MNTSEGISKIAAALLKAQKAITYAVKEANNPQFKSKYADLSAVIDACKPALNGAGISFMQMPAPSDPGTLALTTRLIHESGEWIESTATCPLQKHDPQGYGSATTYLRRYSLASAVGLYQDDDDGNAASKPKPVKITPAAAILEDAAISDARRAELDKLAVRVSETFYAYSAQAAFETIDQEGLDDIEKVYLSTKLDSSVRNPITAYSRQLKKAA